MTSMDIEQYNGDSRIQVYSIRRVKPSVHGVIPRHQPLSLTVTGSRQQRKHT